MISWGQRVAEARRSQHSRPCDIRTHENSLAAAPPSASVSETTSGQGRTRQIGRSLGTGSPQVLPVPDARPLIHSSPTRRSSGTGSTASPRASPIIRSRIPHQQLRCHGEVPRRVFRETHRPGARFAMISEGASRDQDREATFGALLWREGAAPGSTPPIRSRHSGRGGLDCGRSVSRGREPRPPAGSLPGHLHQAPTPQLRSRG